MAYRPIKKEWPQSYLNQQYSAMRWLAKQGLTPEEIRTFTWGRVDESKKTVELSRKFFHIKYDLKTGIGKQDEEMKTRKVSVKGTGHEWFFTKSRIPCFSWMFTAYPPKSWRRELAKEALFPLEVVEWACRGVENCGKLCNFGGVSVLTESENFGKLKVSKLNFANLERVEEAEIR